MSTAEKKLVKQRLSVLELAEALGNASEACRQRGMSRSQFYEFKRRFQTHGLEGLKDLPPIHKYHPQTTSEEDQKRILEVATEYPMRGCVWISDYLKLRGVSVSSPTVQKILIKNNLGSRYQRLLKLEERALNESIPLTPEQVKAIEKANPCFKERHVESSQPGELLSQDTFYVGHLKGVGKVYLQAVVDTFGSFAFGYLHTGKIPDHAVSILHNDVLPQYQEWNIDVSAVLTDNGREYCGTPSHHYELYLELNDIEHRKTQVRRPQTNGFVERFNRTVLDEFFRIKFREKIFETVDALQVELDEWLKYYNYERPHQGYRNLGKRPFDTIKKFIKSVKKED
jgi:transposase InsO family protein